MRIYASKVSKASKTCMLRNSYTCVYTLLTYIYSKVSKVSNASKASMPRNSSRTGERKAVSVDGF